MLSIGGEGVSNGDIASRDKGVDGKWTTAGWTDNERPRLTN